MHLSDVVARPAAIELTCYDCYAPTIEPSVPATLHGMPQGDQGA